MGNYLSAYLGTQRLDGTRIGTNGSAVGGWLAILLAGYAVGGFPESKRVRERWITEMPLPPYDQLPRRYPSKELGIAYHDRTKVWAWKLIIAYGESTHFIDLSESSIKRGRMLKPVTCSILEALMWLYDNRGGEQQESMRLYGDEVARFADAHTAVLPFLTESASWYGQLLIHERILQAAKKTPGSTIDAG